MTVLPDFIFGRDRELERQGSYVLAGKLVTNIPKSQRKLNMKQKRLIGRLTRSLVHEVAMDPHLREVGIWLDGCRPADGAQPPFDNEQVCARIDACVVIDVIVDRRAAASMH